jgi:hypothetical protein
MKVSQNKINKILTYVNIERLDQGTPKEFILQSYNIKNNTAKIHKAHTFEEYVIDFTDKTMTQIIVDILYKIIPGYDLTKCGDCLQGRIWWESKGCEWVKAVKKYLQKNEVAA